MTTQTSYSIEEVELMMNDFQDIPPIKSKAIILKIREFIKKEVEKELECQKKKNEKKEDKNA